MRKSRGQKPVRAPERQLAAFEADNEAEALRRETKQMDRPEAEQHVQRQWEVPARIARLIVALAHGEQDLGTTAAVRRGLERGYFNDYDGIKSATPQLGRRGSKATLSSIISRARRKLQK